jgi:predicted phage terminase large subunit-like protein
VKLTADIIEAFAGAYLSPRYDSAQPTPDFHRECWERYCGPDLACATAAPRNHAKSTALTHDYGLAAALFRDEPYIIIVGSSEDMAIEHLGDIANELRENDDLIRDFKIKGFLVDQKTDIIVECTDGYQFRFIARGAEQKIRGRKWRGHRPGLIIFDDIEDDEQVENKDRRRKFRKWFFRACKQALRDGGKIRGHGTILHEDSLLSRLMKNGSWNSKKYRAHLAFNDFSSILWPEKFPEARLRAIRQEFINEGDSAGYSQEYLNDPFDFGDRYLRSEDFLPMSEEDYERQKVYCVGADFAVSTKDAANRTSFTIGGKDAENTLHHVDQRTGRWATDEWIDEMFLIQKRWNPEYFFVEDGVIWKAVAPTVYREMQKRDTWINLHPINPTQDKAARARPMQKRMRAGGNRYDKKAPWYPEFEAELLSFVAGSEAILDDQFDSAAILSKGVEIVQMTDADDFKTEEEEEFEFMAKLHQGGGDGRSHVTGY